MKRKFSQQLIWKAQEFARAAKEELGDELGDERVCAMFDAFDPGLQRQMFMELLMGHSGGTMRVRLVDNNTRNKIGAIKAVRSVTRFGLKEAKDVIDTADNSVGVIDGNWNTEDYNKLKYELQNTGYELV
jgi:ribosomal protein L7/L12